MDKICADCKQPVSVAIDQGDDVNYYHDDSDNCINALWSALETAQKEAAELREENTGLRNMMRQVIAFDSIEDRQQALQQALARTEKEK